jgi:hypothetical protein
MALALHLARMAGNAFFGVLEQKVFAHLILPFASLGLLGFPESTWTAVSIKLSSTAHIPFSPLYDKQ